MISESEVIKITKLYYTAPDDKIFNEVRDKAIELWESNYSDQFGYVTEKTAPLKRMSNVRDNLMSIVAQFDSSNQRKLAKSLSREAQHAIRLRMLDGGMPEQYIYFLEGGDDK